MIRLQDKHIDPTFDESPIHRTTRPCTAAADNTLEA
jgi:hypothetical protein